MTILQWIILLKYNYYLKDMNTKLSNIQLITACLLMVCTILGCQKKYPYFIPDGTPGSGADSASISVDTSMLGIDAGGYAKARIFPGLVGVGEPRLKNYQVTLDLDYKYVSQNLRISVPPRPQFSVGLYAPPGELIEIDVPPGLYGLSVQIGAWTDNLSNKVSPKRVPVIYVRQQLVPGKNFIRNLYGGTIYIWAGRPVSNPVTLTFTGAVKSPDFILGETDPAKWWQEVQKSEVPWLELRSPNLIITLPRKRFIQEHITDPSKAIEFWNNVISEDYYGWMGLSDHPTDPADQSPLLPYRAVLDIEISAGYGHNGYPVMMFNDQYWFNSFANYTTLRELDAWGTFHELGHNCQQTGMWSWNGLGETTNNLFIFKTAHRMDYRKFIGKLHGGLDESFAKGLSFAEESGGKAFSSLSDPFLKLLPFLQMFHFAGWDFMPYLYSQARHAERTSANDQDKKDFVYEALCNFTQKDYIPFFNAWGISVSKFSKSQIQAKGYPLITKQLWTYNPITDTGGTAPYIYDPYDQSNWTIVDFSTDEESGEGPHNGRAKYAIDGSNSTFWHSKWSGSGSSLPQWIEIDMGRIIPVTRFHFVQRQNNSSVRIRDCDIMVSNDGLNWRQYDTFTDMPNQTAPFFYTRTRQSFRYFKIIVNHSWSSVFCALAEVWVTND